MERNQHYHEARRQVERRIGFGIHLAVFATVNSGLILFNLLAVPDRLWSIWPLAGWGIGLLFHGLAVALHAPGTHWKQRMIEQEMKKRS
ncbi:MAG TPA: 2TM domain-containing protein [Noviherbaspirillum sp.]|jgi:hypothetical protein|uniref:2TM domain-containing protein n=1 Tax=Noviherbaspirillum sp. TaxID=1926288 RepID=UPI002F93AE58